MPSQRLSDASALTLTVFAAGALLTVIYAAAYQLLTGYVPPPGADEGLGARIFQVLVLAMFVAGIVFGLSADWTRPWHSGRRLIIPAAALALALAIIYYFEQVYNPGFGPRP